ncbi:MAG: lamin tail domain-containing protein [Candidatus Altiarchaeia archaeon]
MKDNKGLSSIFDVMILGIIIVMAIAYLQVFSITHQSTKITDIKDETTGIYASNALRLMDYISSDADYQTVQTGTLEIVSDKDFNKVVEMSEKAREYTHKLDGILENWSNNETALKEHIEEISDELTGEIENIQGNISGIQALLGETEDSINSINTQCADIMKNLEEYKTLLGGDITGEESPCGYVKNIGGGLSDKAKNISTGLQEINDQLEDAKKIIKDINGSVEENADKILEIIQQARCVLRKVNVEMDNYVTYLQLGVKEEATLMDLLPAKADLKTKTITETVGEALYVEDRLTQSDLLRAMGAGGYRVATEWFNGTNQENNTLNEETCNQTKQKCPQCANCLGIYVHYDAGGPTVDDRENLIDEYVTLKNIDCMIPCQIKDWKIKDNASRGYTFKDVTIPVGKTLTLHSGNGADNQTDAYWNSAYLPNPAIWNNDGDTLYLSYEGLLLQTYAYDKYGNAERKTHCNPEPDNETGCNETHTSLNNTKNRIIQAAILTLIREDYRNLAQKAVKQNLDQTLTSQGYKYCYTAQTCCSQITTGTCPPPENAATSQRSIPTAENETAQMTLSIWR